MGRFPETLKYTKDHEWAKMEGNKVVIGVTDHAQSALGDIVYLDLPQVGRTLKSHETFGVVESIKAVSDLYCPLAGKVVEVNSALKDDPAQINKDAHGSWLMKLEPADASEFGKLMDAKAYSSFVESLK
jgi:glycine cleavage system H protein